MQNAIEALTVLKKLTDAHKLNESEKAVLAILLLTADGETECSLAVNELAAMCGKSPSHVRRTLKSLEDKKLISRAAQYYDAEKTERAPNKFVLRFHG
jgi:DNA-binding MarR family transcriptional regulator